AALKREPNNPTYQYNLAVVRIKSLDPQKSGPARETLQRLAKIAEFRAGSLRALLNDAIQHSEFEDADRFAQELQMNPRGTFSDYLLCLELHKKRDEKKFSALLEKVKPVAARDPNDLALLLGWLNQNGLAAEVLRWTEKLPPEEISSPPPAIEVAEALSSQKSWSRLRRWARSGAWGEDEYLRLAYQALATRKSRQTAADAEFGTIWRAAEQACAEKPER